MPTYEFDLSDGTTVTIESDHEPTDDEVLSALGGQNVSQVDIEKALAPPEPPTPPPTEAEAFGRVTDQPLEQWQPEFKEPEPPVDVRTVLTGGKPLPARATPEDIEQARYGSLLGIDPSKVPSGAEAPMPAAAIPVSAMYKAGAGVLGYATSPQGIFEFVSAMSPAAPAIYLKWAKDMFEGGIESVDELKNNLTALISSHINELFTKNLSRDTGEPGFQVGDRPGQMPSDYDPARFEQDRLHIAQGIAESTVNSLLMFPAAIGAGRHGARRMIKRENWVRDWGTMGTPEPIPERMEGEYASGKREAKTLYEALSPQSLKGAQEVPAQKGGARVQPLAPGKEGEVVLERKKEDTRLAQLDKSIADLEQEVKTAKDPEVVRAARNKLTELKAQRDKAAAAKPVSQMTRLESLEKKKADWEETLKESEAPDEKAVAKKKIAELQKEIDKEKKTGAAPATEIKLEPEIEYSVAADPMGGFSVMNKAGNIKISGLSLAEARSHADTFNRRHRGIGEGQLSPEEQKLIDDEAARMDKRVEVVPDIGEGDPFAKRKALGKVRKWEPNRIARANKAADTLEINPEEFWQWLRNVPEKYRQRAVRSLLWEERLHMEISDTAAATYWRYMSPLEQATVMYRYTGKIGDQARLESGYGWDAKLWGQEALRGRLQQLAEMDVREIAEAAGVERWKLKSISIVETALRGLREWREPKSAPELKSMMDKIQSNIDAAKKTIAGEKVDVGEAGAGDPGAIRKKPGESEADFLRGRIKRLQGAVDLADLRQDQEGKEIWTQRRDEAVRRLNEIEPPEAGPELADPGALRKLPPEEGERELLRWDGSREREAELSKVDGYVPYNLRSEGDAWLPKIEAQFKNSNELFRLLSEGEQQTGASMTPAVMEEIKVKAGFVPAQGQVFGYLTDYVVDNTTLPGYVKDIVDVILDADPSLWDLAERYANLKQMGPGSDRLDFAHSKLVEGGFFSDFITMEDILSDLDGEWMPIREDIYRKNPGLASWIENKIPEFKQALELPEKMTSAELKEYYPEDPGAYRKPGEGEGPRENVPMSEEQFQEYLRNLPKEARDRARLERMRAELAASKKKKVKHVPLSELGQPQLFEPTMGPRGGVPGKEHVPGERTFPEGARVPEEALGTAYEVPDYNKLSVMVVDELRSGKRGEVPSFEKFAQDARKRFGPRMPEAQLADAWIARIWDFLAGNREEGFPGVPGKELKAIVQALNLETRVWGGKEAVRRFAEKDVPDLFDLDTKEGVAEARSRTTGATDLAQIQRELGDLISKQGMVPPDQFAAQLKDLAKRRKNIEKSITAQMRRIAEEQKYRYRVMSVVGQKLISMATDLRAAKPLERKSIGLSREQSAELDKINQEIEQIRQDWPPQGPVQPDVRARLKHLIDRRNTLEDLATEDIAWWRSHPGDAWREISEAESKNAQVLGRLLSKEARQSGQLVTESTSLVAMIDPQTQKVHVVDAHLDPRRGYMITDPQRPHRLAPEYARLAERVGKYRFIHRILLNDPVKGFHQVFDSIEDFNRRIGKRATEISRREAENIPFYQRAAGLEEGRMTREDYREAEEFKALAKEEGVDVESLEKAARPDRPWEGPARTKLTDAEAEALIGDLINTVDQIRSGDDVARHIGVLYENWPKAKELAKQLREARSKFTEALREARQTGTILWEQIEAAPEISERSEARSPLQAQLRELSARSQHMEATRQWWRKTEAEQRQLIEEIRAKAPEDVAAAEAATGVKSKLAELGLFKSTEKKRARAETLREKLANSWQKMNQLEAEYEAVKPNFQVISAYNKIYKHIRQRSPKITASDALTKTFNEIADRVQRAKTGDEFIQEAVKTFGQPGPKDVPGGRAAPSFGRELTMRERVPPTVVREGPPIERRPAPEPPEGLPGPPRPQPKLTPAEAEFSWAQTTQKYPGRTGHWAPVPPETGLQIWVEDPGALRKYTKAGTRKLYNALGEVMSMYSGWMVDRLRDYALVKGDPQVEMIANAFNEMISQEKDVYGRRLTPVLDPAKRAAGAISNTRATYWLKRLDEVHPGAATANVVRAIEGTITVPAYAQEVVDLAKTANLTIGQLYQSVTRYFQATGKFQRNLNAYGYDIVRTGGGEMWNKWTEALAAINNVPLNGPGSIRDFFRKWKKLLDQAAPDFNAIEKVNQDFSRKYPKTITHLHDGTAWQAVMHADLFNYLEAAARRSSHAVAFRRQFPNNPYGIQKLKQVENIIDTRMNATGQSVFDALLRTLQGHPTDNYSRLGAFAPGEIIPSMTKAFNDTVGNLFAKMALTGQMFIQPAETVLGATPYALGSANTARAWARIMAKRGALLTEMELRGAINRVIYDWSLDPHGWVRAAFKNAGNVLSRGFMENYLNEMQELTAAVTARIVTERIVAGHLNKWERRNLPLTMRDMGFTQPQVNRMMAGDTRLLDQFQRRAAAWLTTGNKALAEGSVLSSKRWFNRYFRFQSYPMMKMNQFRQAARRMGEAWDSGDWGKRVIAARHMARFLFWTTMQGAITTGIATWFYKGSEGVRVAAQEAEDEPIKFMVESALAALGGPLYLIWRTARYRGIGGFGEQATRMFFPYTIITEVYNMTRGIGRYRDKDMTQKIGEFLDRKVPGSRAISGGLGAFGLSQEDKKLDAALDGYYRWRLTTFGYSKMDEDLKEDDRREFRTAMKKAVEYLNQGRFDEYGEQLARALSQAGVKSKDVAASLRGMKVLKNQHGQKLDPDQEDALRERIGDDAVERLHYYNLMLEAAADVITNPQEHRYLPKFEEVVE